MKVLLLAALLFTLGSGAVLAEEHGNRFLQFEETDMLASDLMGATLYVTQTEVDEAMLLQAPLEEWESAGNIDDVVMNRDGEIRGVLVDVGGFLGIGARTVMVSFDALHLVERAEERGVFVVMTATPEQLEQAPEVDRDQIGLVRDPAVATTPAERDRVGVAEPAPGFERVEFAALTAEQLIGANVFDRFNENVADVGDVVLSEDGTQVQAMLVDIGGFLGIGTRTVSVNIEQTEIFHDPQTREVAVYIDMTQEELEALPEYQR